MRFVQVVLFLPLLSVANAVFASPDQIEKFALSEPDHWLQQHSELSRADLAELSQAMVYAGLTRHAIAGYRKLCVYSEPATHDHCVSLVDNLIAAGKMTEATSVLHELHAQASNDDILRRIILRESFLRDADLLEDTEGPFLDESGDLWILKFDKFLNTYPQLINISSGAQLVFRATESHRSSLGNAPGN